MKILIGLLLAGLLAFANAQAQSTQNEGANLADLASQVPAVTRDRPVETKPAQKTAQSVLQAVEAVVASMTPGSDAAEPSSAPAAQAAEGTRVASPATPTNEAETPTVETNPEVLPENDEAETEATPEAAEEAVQPEEKPANEVVMPTKKQLKAIAKYNEAIDQVAIILSQRLEDMGPIPLQVDEETLMALDEKEPEPEVTTVATLRKNKNKKNKRRKNQKRKNNHMEETRDDVEESSGSNRKNNKNSNEKNNNKNNNKSNEKNKGGDKSSNEKNKNRNKNKNKRNRNNKKNKKNGREDGVQRRQPKDFDDDDMEETEGLVQGRRKNGQSQHANRKNNKKNKNRSNKKNKKNKNKKNKGREDIENREAELPTIPTAEERAESNAKMTGFSRIQRHGDVAVVLTGRRDEVSALLIMGPLEVQLKDKSRALTRAKVNTFMSAVAQFRVKSVRGRSKIHLKEITMSNLEPQHVAVTRDDVELDPELVSEAQTQVAQAVDMERIGRILKAELINIFDKDNIVENLENHPFHKKN